MSAAGTVSVRLTRPRRPTQSGEVEDPTQHIGFPCPFCGRSDIVVFTFEDANGEEIPRARWRIPCWNCGADVLIFERMDVEVKP